jgi:ubiquinone/menaquinone biosynthesis C-methylase UbiE
MTDAKKPVVPAALREGATKLVRAGVAGAKSASSVAVSVATNTAKQGQQRSKDLVQARRADSTASVGASVSAAGTALAGGSGSSVSKDAKSLTTRKREVPSDFNIVAGTYDTLVTRNPGYLDHLGVSASRLDLPNEGEGLRLLDLCCGTGLSTEALLKAFPKATIVGLDASSGMLDLARTKPATKAAGVRFVLGDAMDPRAALNAELGTEPDGSDAKFDGVLMAYGIRNMPDPDACLAVLHSILKPGAPICFHEYSVADSPRAKGTWTTVAWGIIIPSGLITSRHTRIYRYLWRSVMDFDGKRAFEDRVRSAGFVSVHTEPMDGWQKDIVHSFLAKEPNAAASDPDLVSA